MSSSSRGRRRMPPAAAEAEGEEEAEGAEAEEDAAPATVDEPADAPLAPHLRAGSLPLGEAERPDYVLVIPSFRRARMLAQRTMQLLIQQLIPLDRVFIFVAAEAVKKGQEDERARYLKELVPLGLPEANIITGVRGVMDQRNFIVRWILEHYPPLQHVVSLDDDLEALCYKVRTGFDHNGNESGFLRDMEPGGLEAWFAHAEEAMKRTGSHIWSLSTSKNVYFMRSDLIGTANGMCNGYLYGFRARPNEELLPRFQNATEDRERSVRYFASDGVVLRYKMYTAKTRCFCNLGGIQDHYQGSLNERKLARKQDEREGHRRIEEAFPTLYCAEPKKGKKALETMEGTCRHVAASEPRIAYGLGSNLEPRRRGEGRPPRKQAGRRGRRAAPSPARKERKAKEDDGEEEAEAKEAASPSASSTAPAPGRPPSCRRPPMARRLPAAGLPAAAGSEGEELGGARERSEGEELGGASNWAGGVPRPQREQSWACAICTCRNPAVVLACVACGSVRPAEDAWKCLRCEVLSPESDERCVGCGLARGDNQQGSFTVYVDSDSESESESEEGDAPETLPDVEELPSASKRPRLSGSGAWACETCTFLNGNTEAPVCEICGAARL